VREEYSRAERQKRDSEIAKIPLLHRNRRYEKRVPKREMRASKEKYEKRKKCDDMQTEYKVKMGRKENNMKEICCIF